MASRIQGITVEIGGDTTKLTTALKGVNSEIRNTQSQLRDVEKLLKLDPGNTELLSQKQRLLNQEVQTTKEKLEELKRASEQANAALEHGTITQSQYDALQREIIATEQALEDLEEQAEQSAVALQKIILPPWSYLSSVSGYACQTHWSLHWLPCHRHSKWWSEYPTHLPLLQNRLSQVWWNWKQN